MHAAALPIDPTIDAGAPRPTCWCFARLSAWQATTVFPKAVVAASTPVSCAIRASAAACCSLVSVPRKRVPRGVPLNRSSRSSGADTIGAEEVESGIETASRQRDVLGEELRTGNHTRFAEGRQPHRLSRVEFRILKCRETDQTIDERRRQCAPINVHLIARRPPRPSPASRQRSAARPFAATAEPSKALRHRHREEGVLPGSVPRPTPVPPWW